MELIEKAAVVAEIKRRLDELYNMLPDTSEVENGIITISEVCNTGKYTALESFKDYLDTLEVKEVEEKFECPNIKVKDSVEVSSRMPHIDKRLLPIAEFIMDYCSWNLHKDEWNQPVIEVPLFRVLDALVQKGKPYCEG